MVTETFTNKNEIKNPSPHYNCLHRLILRFFFLFLITQLRIELFYSHIHMLRLVVLNPLTNDHGRTFHLSFKHNIQQHLFFIFHPVNMEKLFSFFFYPLHVMVLSSSYYPMHSIVLFSSPVHVMRWYFFFLSTGSSSCHKAKLLSKFCDCIGIFIEF